MKRILKLISTTLLCVSLVACGEQQGLKDQLLGTWEPDSVVIKETILTIREVEDMGDDSLSDFSIIINDNGIAYLKDGDSSEQVTWEKTDDGILIGEVECSIEEDYVILENNGIQIRLKKSSDEQMNTIVEENNNESEETEDFKNEAIENDILEIINSDVNSTITSLNEKFDLLVSETGSYEEYLENKSKIDEFYLTIEIEMKELGNRIASNSEEYFRYIVATVDHDDIDALNGALDEYYDQVVNSACDSVYDGVSNGLLDKILDAYYYGVIDIAYNEDKIDYEAYSAASSEAYEQWSDAFSSNYAIWSDMFSLFYNYWADVNSELIYQNNYDIESIIINLDEPSFGEESSNLILEEENIENSSDIEIETNGVKEEILDDSKWRDFLARYEAWVDDYIAFLEKYNENPLDLTLITEYGTLTVDQIQWATDASELEGELSDEELVLYLETLTRINAKLNDAILNLY